MELSQLRYYQTVSRLEHFTRAAEVLHISQPSLSKSIANLEEELGVQLFDRDNRNVHLNGYGRAFLVHVDKIMFELNEAVTELKDMKTGEGGSIRIASTFFLDSPTGFSSYTRDFFFSHPEVSLHVYYMDAGSMFPLLRERRINFALVTNPIPDVDVVNEELYSYRMGLVVPREDPLARRESVRLEELRDYRFVCNNSSPDQRDTIFDICGRAGFRPHIRMECDDADLIGEAVSKGLGITFVTERRFRENDVDDPTRLWRKNTAFVRVEDEFCVRTIRVAYLRGAYHTACERNFLQGLKEHFRSLQ